MSRMKTKPVLQLAASIQENKKKREKKRYVAIIGLLLLFALG
jgi:hypothetical protein